MVSAEPIDCRQRGASTIAKRVWRRWQMRVRKAKSEELRWKRLIEARGISHHRSRDDEPFQCSSCGAELQVSAALARDPLGVFCCPHCAGWSLPTE